MDCIIYSHASLLDMIEKESAEFEQWYTASPIAEPHSKHCSFFTGSDVISAKSTSLSLFDDLNRLESLNGSVLNSSLQMMDTDWRDREECMNWDPQLLVNPRTGAPVDINDSDSIISNSKFALEKNVKSVLNGMTFPESIDVSSTKSTDVTPGNDNTIPSRQLQTFTTFTIAEPSAISNASVPITLQSRLIASSTNTVPVQVFLQVANAVGSIVPSDGTLCLIKMEEEEQAVQLPSSSAATQIPTASVRAEEENDEVAAESNENFEKPVFSYSCLIAMALKNSESGSLPVNEIYAYILEKFPYFRTAPDGWKNSIRHNLSLNKCFEKIENPTVNGGSRKGCLWGLNPAKADKMDDEIAKWIKRAAKANNNGKETVSNQLLHSAVALNDGESRIITQPSTSAYVTVCSQHQNMNALSGSAVNVSTPTGEFDILEDSIESSDPMLAGIAVQNGLWDDLTETDELMSTVFSFGNGQLTKSNKSSTVNSRIRMSSASSCRSSHSKATSSFSSIRPNTSSTSVAIIANQAAIG